LAATKIWISVEPQLADDCAPHLILGSIRIDELATHVSRDPDLVDLDLIFRVDAQLDDFREVPR